jgi:hypothetical protein
MKYPLNSGLSSLTYTGGNTVDVIMKEKYCHIGTLINIRSFSASQLGLNKILEQSDYNKW